VFAFIPFALAFFSSLDDLVKYTELDNVHDDGKDGHDEYDLDRGLKEIEHIVAEPQESGGDIWECEGEDD
jgi:hypothetical protein